VGSEVERGRRGNVRAVVVVKAAVVAGKLDTQLGLLLDPPQLRACCLWCRSRDGLCAYA
jgi:hypothetical protein